MALTYKLSKKFDTACIQIKKEHNFESKMTDARIYNLLHIFFKQQIQVFRLPFDSLLKIF